MFKRKKDRSSLHPIAEAEHQNASALTQSDIDIRMKRINKDFRSAFEVLKEHPDTVTFFGSARFKEDNIYYQQARLLARRIVEEVGSTVVTGGGGGIMEAANRGARDVQGESVGMTIELPHEQVTNDYVDWERSADFYYFFSRKVALSFTARAYVYFPGGFGTLDEFFEILTLKQTAKIKPIPIILVGVEYWKPLLNFIETDLRDKYKSISPSDTSLYELTDDLDEAMKIIAATSPSELAAVPTLSEKTR